MTIFTTEEVSRRDEGDIVGALEALLAQAKDGKLSTLAYAYETNRGDEVVGLGFEHGEGGSIYVMVGALDVLKSRLVKMILAAQEEDET